MALYSDRDLILIGTSTFQMNGEFNLHTLRFFSPSFLSHFPLSHAFFPAFLTNSPCFFPGACSTLRSETITHALHCLPSLSSSTASSDSCLHLDGQIPSFLPSFLPMRSLLSNFFMVQPKTMALFLYFCSYY